jgi:hypothetical protein
MIEQAEQHAEADKEVRCFLVLLVSPPFANPSFSPHSAVSSSRPPTLPTLSPPRPTRPSRSSASRSMPRRPRRSRDSLPSSASLPSSRRATPLASPPLRSRRRSPRPSRLPSLFSRRYVVDRLPHLPLGADRRPSHYRFTSRAPRASRPRPPRRRLPRTSPRRSKLPFSVLSSASLLPYTTSKACAPLPSIRTPSLFPSHFPLNFRTFPSLPTPPLHPIQPHPVCSPFFVQHSLSPQLGL